jgi:Secretion system C-terminal sorting domain
MRKVFTFFLLFSFCVTNAQIIEFSDANFKTKLLQANTDNDIAFDVSYNRIKIDTNNDGEIESSEANSVYHLYVTGSNISNIIGIEYFDSIETLDVSNNQLTNLNLNIPTLESFICRDNQLTSLLLDFPVLSHLDITNNLLTSLDLTSCYPNLGEVYVQNNQLSSLQLPMNTPLEYLNISYNNFDGFDLTSVHPYIYFTYGNNPNDKVIFPNGFFLSAGGIFYSSETATHLDLSSLYIFGDTSGVFYIKDSPNLTSINCINDFIYSPYTINEGGNIITIYPNEFKIINCPNLNLVCCDEGEVDYFNAPGVIQTTNQVTISSECSSLLTPIFELEMLTIYPNPTKSILNISLPENREPNSISVYNPLGQLVVESQTSNSIDVSSLTTGTYFVKVLSEDQIFTQKFIKQ